MADEITTDGIAHEAVGRAGGYVVIARRYRPQTFSELIGQEHVAQGLAAAIAASRVGHAYLFTGARGTGKTSAARILAKALNCKNGPTPTPCNQCDICRSITTGEDMDVLEIDGASNRGIDEIRQLRQNVNVRPSRARFKVYIIDEVHMLTEPAFNALLKTLEEPPEHVKFIFCTTEPEKIPITILSRCQRFDFAGIQTKQIVERLRQIAVGEGVNAEPQALELLALRAAGSMRDSQSLLEQLLAFGSKGITVADVHRLLGTAGSDRISRLVEKLIARDAAAALAELGQAVSDGVDVGQLLSQLLGYFRDVMAAAAGCPADALLHVLAGEFEKVRSTGLRLGLETILAVLQILDQTISRLKFLTHPRTVAEIALVRICKLEDLDALQQLISQMREGWLPTATTAAGTAVIQADTSSVASKKKHVEPIICASSDFNESAASGTVIPSEVQPENGKNESSLHQANTARSPFDCATARPAEEKLQINEANGDLLGINSADGPPFSLKENETASKSAIEIWQIAAERLGGLAAEKAQQAKNAAISAPNKLVVIFPKRYNFCKQFCERPEMVLQLKEIIEELAGRALQLEFRLSDDETTKPAEPQRAANPRQRMYEACQRPFVRQAMELFEATAQRLEEPAKG
ncbi:MAG TPA: DNA polymerase III subunit gamma/tau [Pirellulales bacterium]|jgi:DNA polymerase-3 subunit gamma/tau|nr:DNA polymerase III subunit gamma/tau [Pirellulales bacterium]